jgi:hypothetical protein
MRKYLLGLFAIVMAVSLSAFTGAKSSEATGKAIDLYWFEYDHSGTGTVGTYLDYGDRSEFLNVPCNLSVGNDCRRGYTLTDLVDQSDPEQGVINKNANSQQIKKP